jgi:hypothetical protein
MASKRDWSRAGYTTTPPELRRLNGLQVSERPWYGKGATRRPPVRVFTPEEIAAYEAANPAPPPLPTCKKRI